MIRARSIRSYFAIFALMIFAVPASGAHLHLCLDGTDSERPASLHLVDDRTHYSEDADRGHLDVDMSLDSEAMAKKVRGSQDVPASLPASQLFELRIPVSVEIPADPQSLIVPVSDSRIRPPLRAPPV